MRPGKNVVNGERTMSASRLAIAFVQAAARDASDTDTAPS